MIVHVVPDTVYGDDFINFLGEMYNSKDHYSYVSVGVGKTHIVAENKVSQWAYLSKDNMREFSKKAKEADLLIIHGLFNLLVILWLFFNPRQAKKTIISIWGGELYDHREILENKNIEFRKRVLDCIKGKVFRSVPVFLNDMDDDYELLQQWYHVRAKSMHILYPPSVDKDFLDRLLNEKKSKEPESRVKILVGNSATETNFHEDAFHKLEKFKMENVEIYCPLSYGSDSYANEVILAGKEIFGDKFHGITDFMCPDQYIRFLAGMDIAIFNNNRNQAMGNIALLAYLGCKVYIRNDTVMWKQYVVRGGCAFFPVDDIEREDYLDLCENDLNSIRVNRDYFNRQWNERNLKDIWDKVFSIQLKGLE